MSALSGVGQTSKGMHGRRGLAGQQEQLVPSRGDSVLTDHIFLSLSPKLDPLFRERAPGGLLSLGVPQKQTEVRDRSWAFSVMLWQPWGWGG